MRNFYYASEYDDLLSIIRDDDILRKYIGLTSGYFHPTIHTGHISLLKHCQKYVSHLIVVVNGSKSTNKKYGYEAISAEDRAEIISAIGCVDQVIIYDEDDMAQAILDLKPGMFLKGGDRKLSNGSIKNSELIACEEVGTIIIDGVGGYDKKNSNSSITKNILDGELLKNE